MIQKYFAVTCCGLLLGIAANLYAQDEISDFSGIWFGGAPVPVLPGDPPKKDEPPVVGGGTGVTIFPSVLTEHGEEVMAAFDPIDDPAVRCEHPGLVRVILNPYPMKIEQIEGNLVISYEEWTTERLVHLNSTLPQDLEPSLLGYSVGHFDDGRLVVRSIGTTRGLGRAGRFLWVSEEASIVEEYSINERGQLILDFTLTDPVMLQEPWRVEKILNPYDQELLSFECEIWEMPGAD